MFAHKVIILSCSAVIASVFVINLTIIFFRNFKLSSRQKRIWSYEKNSLSHNFSQLIFWLELIFLIATIHRFLQRQSIYLRTSTHFSHGPKFLPTFVQPFPWLHLTFRLTSISVLSSLCSELSFYRNIATNFIQSYPQLLPTWVAMWLMWTRIDW